MLLLAALFNLAILTSDKYPEEKKPDDKLLLEALHAYDVEAKHVDWNTEDCNWSQFDAVLVYSTWDYYENHSKFIKVLNKIENQGVKVYNPPSIIEWNSCKTYLKDLKNLGLNTIDSVFISASELDNLRTLVVDNGWDECVIKPQISTSGHGTYRFNLSTLEEIRSLLKDSREDFIVQPFAEEVVTEGEWSFVFFDNEYLHCILKKPNEGEFLVQKGTKIIVQPQEWMIQEAKKIVKTINMPVLQMRVDVIRQKDSLKIMEVEMIEPSLYLRYFPQSEKIVAQKLCEKLRN
jgi:glutathione synthase/RimK-type ligase-like ATP-grasp enzyme